MLTGREICARLERGEMRRLLARLRALRGSLGRGGRWKLQATVGWLVAQSASVALRALLAREGGRGVAFLGRDAWLCKVAFDAGVVSQGQPWRSRYLYASRRAWLLPGYAYNERKLWETWARPVQRLRWETWLRALRPGEALQRRLGRHPRTAWLFREGRVDEANLLEARLAFESAPRPGGLGELLRYVRLGGPDEWRFDLGWNGSTAELCQRELQAGERDVLWASLREGRARGLVVDAGSPAWLRRLVAERADAIEVIVGASHAPVARVGREITHGRWRGPREAPARLDFGGGCEEPGVLAEGLALALEVLLDDEVCAWLTRGHEESGLGEG